MQYDISDTIDAENAITAETHDIACVQAHVHDPEACAPEGEILTELDACRTAANDGRRYSIGDQVLVPLTDGRQAPGRVTKLAAHRYCFTCHCEPINPDHAGDGSLCCPGPFYSVTITCPGDNGHLHEHVDNAYAEHELERRILCDVTCGADCTKCLAAC